MEKLKIINNSTNTVFEVSQKKWEELQGTGIYSLIAPTPPYSKMGGCGCGK